MRGAVARRIQKVMAGAEGPAVVADTVIKAVRARQPKLRYTAGGLAACLRLLRSFAPASLMDAGMRRDLRLA